MPFMIGYVEPPVSPYEPNFARANYCQHEIYNGNRYFYFIETGIECCSYECLIEVACEEAVAEIKAMSKAELLERFGVEERIYEA